MDEKLIHEKIINAGILKGHNINSYINVVKMFEKEDRVCIEHATGTGKSFIALQLMYDNSDKKIMYLVPRNGIGDQVEEHILHLSEDARKKYFPNVVIRTYQSLLNMTKQELSSLEVDYLITDEYHHIVSPEWIKRIETIDESHPNLKMFGMTATPTRASGTLKEENVSETFFKGNVASRRTLADAIAQGILKAPRYITTSYNFDNDISKIKEKILSKNTSDEVRSQRLNELQRLEEKAKKIVGEAPSFEEILKNNLKPNGKYIIFCPRGGLDQTIESAKTGWLKNIASEENTKIYFSTSEKIKESRKNQEEFYNDDSDKLRLMFAMDMYNEGIHVPDIDGVIMLRPSKSDIIFYQQLGRALACNPEKEHPLVLDFVNNIHSVMRLSNEIRNIIKQNNLNSNTENNMLDDIIDFDVSEEELELLDFMKELDESLTLSNNKKIEEFIEIINNPKNKINALIGIKIREMEFSNGDKISFFWQNKKEKIKEELQMNPKYEFGYDQAKLLVFPKEINRISEFIEIINNPENKYIALKGKEIKDKKFSNGEKVGYFWENHKNEVKLELQTNSDYEIGYDQAKEKTLPKEIDKVSEFIEIINNPENKELNITSKKNNDKEFSNGGKIIYFWNKQKEKIKEELQTNPKYEFGYDQAKEKVFPKEIDKVSEFIEIINNSENKGVKFTSIKIGEKEFSNGDKVKLFGSDANDRIKKELQINPKYAIGYDQAKMIMFPKEIDKISEFIEIINNPENKYIALKGKEIKDKEFSNGDKVGCFWGANKEKIKEQLLNNPKYEFGYELARKRILYINIDKISEFIEILNNPENKYIALYSEKFSEKEFSNGDRVGFFVTKWKEELKKELETNPKYAIGYDQAKQKISPKEVDKVSEFIEILNNPVNKFISLSGKDIKEKEFSNGDKIGYFWYQYKEILKKELRDNPKYKMGYDQAKSKVFPKKINKVSEYIEIINAPENKDIALKGVKMQEKLFSNGDKVGYFWSGHMDDIKKELEFNSEYAIGYDQAKIKVGVLTKEMISSLNSIETNNSTELNENRDYADDNKNIEGKLRD